MVVDSPTTKTRRSGVCKVCFGPLPEPFLDLGLQPLANSFAPKDVELPTHPLAVARCDRCAAIQLTHTVEPAEMFEQYAYKSSISTTWVKHCTDYVDSLVGSGKISSGDMVVEIASNDGFLLEHLQSRGIASYGIEPAANLAEDANRRGLSTFNCFMGVESAETIAREIGRAELVIANNVLAHVPDPIDFLSGIAILLAPEGRLSIESPHALRMIAGAQFDTIYHEHVFYLTTETVGAIADRASLEIVDVEPLPTHGGSMRWILSHKGEAIIGQSVAKAIAEERSSGHLTPAGLGVFAAKAANAKDQFLALLCQSREDGARWAAYGAAAKGVVLANYFGLSADQIEFVVDNNELKQGRVMPGTDIPIVPMAHLVASPSIDNVLVMPWNIAAEIAKSIDTECRTEIKKWVAIPSPGAVS